MSKFQQSGKLGGRSESAWHDKSPFPFPVGGWAACPDQRGLVTAQLPWWDLWRTGPLMAVEIHSRGGWRCLFHLLSHFPSLPNPPPQKKDWTVGTSTNWSDAGVLNLPRLHPKPPGVSVPGSGYPQPSQKYNVIQPTLQSSRVLQRNRYLQSGEQFRSSSGPSWKLQSINKTCD